VADQAIIAGSARAEVRARPGWPLPLFRAVATLAALGAILQPFLAGLFLSGSFSALKAHEVTGQAVGGLAVLALVCAILYWRVGGGPVIALRMTGGFLIAVVLQIILGYSRILALHVPLGVGLVIGSGQLAYFVWRKAGK
jgi:hypothetical protein